MRIHVVSCICMLSLDLYCLFHVYCAVGLSQPSISTVLTSSNLETLASYGDAVMDIVCKDACEGHHVGRVSLCCFLHMCVRGRERGSVLCCVLITLTMASVLAIVYKTNLIATVPCIVRMPGLCSSCYVFFLLCVL